MRWLRALQEPRQEGTIGRLYNKKDVIPEAALPGRNDAFESWKRRELDGFLEFLGGAEGDLLAGLDLDRFAGGGVAAHAGGALADLKDAEADDADTLALLQVLGDPADQIVQNGLGALLRQFVLFRQRCREMLERDRGRASCVLRHIWPSSLLMAQELQA